MVWLAALIAAQAFAFALSGQSIASGTNSAGVQSSSQTLGNTMWQGNTNSGNYGAPTEGTVPSVTVPLVEAATESPRSAIANCYAELTGRSVLAMSNARSGYGYALLKNGTTHWTALVNMMESYGSRQRGEMLGFVTVHGESDQANTDYDDNLLEWQSDFAALSARVGSGASPPMWISQMSACTNWDHSSMDTCVSPQLQYEVTRDHPSTHIMVGPKYHLASNDGVHLSGANSRLLGEQIGRAMAWGPTWTGVRPRSVSANGAVISVQMWVPVPPLVIDTTAVSDPGNYGFTYTDDDNPPAISSVSISGDDTVVITLASAPTGSNRRIRYAYTGTSGNNAGPTTGMRGNIRDSDTTTCGSGTMLRNWLAHFSEAVP